MSLSYGYSCNDKNMPDAKKPYCQVNQILKTRVRQEGKSSLYYEYYTDPFQGHTIGRFKFYLHSRVHVPKDYTQITTAAKSSSSGYESAVLLCKKDESGMVTLGTLVSIANLCIFCRSLQLVTFYERFINPYCLG